MNEVDDTPITPGATGNAFADAAAGQRLEAEAAARAGRAPAPPVLTRLQSLRAFGAALDDATELLRATEQIDGGRCGCMTALAAVIDLCDLLGWPPERRLTFWRLFLALQAADEGKDDPMLRIRKGHGRPPLTDAERAQRGHLAAAVEALIRDGMTPEGAAKQVAKRAGRMATAARAKESPLWKALLKWREAAMGGNVPDDRDALIFRTTCQMLDTTQGPVALADLAGGLIAKAEQFGKIQENPPFSRDAPPPCAAHAATRWRVTDDPQD